MTISGAMRNNSCVLRSVVAGPGFSVTPPMYAVAPRAVLKELVATLTIRVINPALTPNPDLL